MILIVLVALVLALVGIGSVIYNLINFNSPFGENTAVIAQSSPQTEETPADFQLVLDFQAPKSKKSDKKFNYNFKVATKPVVNTNSNAYNSDEFVNNAKSLNQGQVAGVDTNNTTGNKDNILTPEVKTHTQNITSKPSNLARITVGSARVDSPIIQGADGDKALDQGMWLYPSSTNEGEKVLLCHRRYFGSNDPRSCWFMDRVKVGDTIKLFDKNGTVFKYKVISQAVRNGDDLSIFDASGDDLVKIITCTPLGSSSHRLVTIAKRA